jgi:hypothetical protein
MGVELYNRMPDKTKEQESFKDLKQNLKSFLLDHPFYSLNEFFNINWKILEFFKFDQGHGINKTNKTEKNRLYSVVSNNYYFVTSVHHLDIQLYMYSRTVRLKCCWLGFM